MKMLVAVTQISPKVGEFEKNLLKMEEFINESGKKKVELILFPELSLTGYTWDKDVLEKGWIFFKNVAKEKLLKLSREYDMCIVGGVPRIFNKKLRNSAFVIKKKKEILFYDKTHLFRGEKDIFEAGSNFLIFTFRNVLFGILICYEIGFPEVARILTLKGAQVILSIFAFGKERYNIFDIATRARALENGSFLLASSTCGKGFMDFVGHSRIVSPNGKIMKELISEEGLIFEDLDLDILNKYRYEEIEDSHAYFKNRRPEIYKEICYKRRVDEWNCSGQMV